MSPSMHFQACGPSAARSRPLTSFSHVVKELPRGQRLWIRHWQGRAERLWPFSWRTRASAQQVSGQVTQMRCPGSHHHCPQQFRRATIMPPQRMPAVSYGDSPRRCGRASTPSLAAVLAGDMAQRRQRPRALAPARTRDNSQDYCTRALTVPTVPRPAAEQPSPNSQHAGHDTSRVSGSFHRVTCPGALGTTHPPTRRRPGAPVWSKSKSKC
mmetsp:Transcript_533/g.1430  ORF Transcript_533/g.1430 Transcript_533/m.1430 type:complete len:212 (+) Transcript_533:383-1018(+)